MLEIILIWIPDVTGSRGDYIVSLHTNDMNMERPNRKYRSKISITKEFFKHYLGVPENLDIINCHWDYSREIIHIILEGQEGARYTFEVGEGMEIPQVSPVEWFEEATRRRFQHINSNTEAVRLLREEE